MILSGFDGANAKNEFPRQVVSLPDQLLLFFRHPFIKQFVAGLVDHYNLVWIDVEKMNQILFCLVTDGKDLGRSATTTYGMKLVKPDINFFVKIREPHVDHIVNGEDCGDS